MRICEYVFNKEFKDIYNYVCVVCSDWKKPVAYTPETRTAAHKYMAEKRSEKAPEPKYGNTG